MVDRIDKVLKKFSLKRRQQVMRVTSMIIKGSLGGLDVKKLKGRKDVYRVRVGTVRIIFYMKDEETKIIEIEFRSDTTYN